MSGLQIFASWQGSWTGTSRLEDPHSNLREESPSTATVLPILGGRFGRLDYTWAYRGQPQEGSMLVGLDGQTGELSLHWIDSWHMNDKIMVCVGRVDDSGAINVKGSYAAPPGPDWGWRIVITTTDGSLGVVMNNIWPDGREELAVEAFYVRT